MEEGQVIDALGALSQPLRLQIVRYLVAQGPQGASAGQIGEALGAQPSRLSFHVGILERAGLVASERQSRNIIYRADFEHMGGVIGYLLYDCCGGHPQVAACCGPAAKDDQECC